jgi:hypothetical protein
VYGFTKLVKVGGRAYSNLVGGHKKTRTSLRHLETSLNVEISKLIASTS